MVSAMNEGNYLEVLYEDEAVIAVVKPQGIVSEDTGKDSLPALLREHSGDGDKEIYPVHRLDKPTGGAIVYAKSHESASTISETIAAREARKVYLAVVCGSPEPPQGTLADYLYHDKRQNKVFVVRTKRKGAKEAILDYETIEAIEREGSTFTLLRITLRTGRTHQIRAQFASRRMPIFGDRRYGSKEQMHGGRIALWSHELTLPLLGGEPKTIVSEPPREAPWTFFIRTGKKK